jgi:hypothetical protein
MYKYASLPTSLVEKSDAYRETNDCTVKAFAIAFNTTYDKAHNHLAKHCGRRPRQGIVSRIVLQPSLRHTKTKVGPYTNSNRITLGAFCKAHPEGRYYVRVKGHAIAVVDGTVYDHRDSPRRQVTWALRIYI